MSDWCKRAATHVDQVFIDCIQLCCFVCDNYKCRYCIVYRCHLLLVVLVLLFLCAFSWLIKWWQQSYLLAVNTEILLHYECCVLNDKRCVLFDRPLEPASDVREQQQCNRRWFGDVRSALNSKLAFLVAPWLWDAVRRLPGTAAKVQSWTVGGRKKVSNVVVTHWWCPVTDLFIGLVL